MRADRGVHVHRHLGPGLAGQRDLPADSRGPAARVALRHLPHADQRVTPAPQRELLQVPGQWPVTLLHRLEDPAPQPPYLLLMAPPVHTLPGVTIKHRGQALRSVHRGVQLALWLRHSRSLRLKGSPVHVSALSSPGSKRPGIRFLDTLSRHGISALLTVGLPHRPRIPAHGMRTHCRVCTFRTHETRTGPGALYTPGTAVSTDRKASAAIACRLSAAVPIIPEKPPAREVSVTRHQQGFPGSRPIPVLPLACGRHGWNGGPW